MSQIQITVRQTEGDTQNLTNRSISDLVRERIDSWTYSSEGQLEWLETKVERTQMFVGELIEILVEKKILDLSDIQNLLTTEKHEPIKITFEKGE